MAEQDPSQPADEERVERIEGCGCLLCAAVAVLGDPEEPHAVPPGPDVHQKAEVVRELRAIPPIGERMPVRLEEQEGEDDSGPDSRARPKEDIENTTDAATLLHPGRGKRRTRGAPAAGRGDGREAA